MGAGTAWGDTVTDALTASDFAATSTTYTDFSNVSKTSDAVYAGQSAKDSSGNIQMRSKNSNSGIVSTTSGGKLKSVTITVGSGSNTVDVYGSNTAYTAASDLYSSSTQGTKLGSVSATGTITVTGDYTYVGIRSNNGAIYLSKVEIEWETDGGSSTPTCAVPTFSPEAGTYTVAQEVTISTTTEGATIYYTTDGNDPTANSSVYSAAIPVSETMTIKAIAVAEGYDNSAIATATYTIVSFEHAGTEADPYTVADARAAIDANAGMTGVYATGIVSAIPTEYNTQHSNITFNFVDIEGDEVFLQAYRCIGDKVSEVQVGDIVVVYGDLKKYNSTYEFGQSCELVSLQHPDAPVVPAINADDVELAYDATSGEIAYTIANPVDGVNLTATSTADWISGITVDESAVTFTTTANEGQADRTATITLSYEGATAVDVTVTQKHYVADYATLPFEFDGGSASIANIAGLTASGLGSDYNSSPKLKFDDTDDYVILKINEAPGKLIFDIKGNSFSNGTFTVQTSADGETYTNLATYTELGTKQSEEFDNLDESVRYIKWVYTEKVSGNVALGNITLARPSTAPVITVAETTIDVDCAEAEGTIDLSYANIEISEMSDFGIQFYDAEGEEIDEPAWIEVTVAAQGPQVGEGYVLSYYIMDNEGEARTAYFKVFAMGNEDFVYSDLVTVTQAAYVAPGEWALTALADLTTDDTFVIVGYNGDTYAMSNDKGTGSAPAAVEVTVAADNTLSGTIADNLMWKVSGNATDGYTFYPNNSKDTWMYCINDNNGVRVGTGDAKLFTLSDGYLTTNQTADQRYIGIYSSQDWRCYKNTTGNIAGQTFSFYKNTAKKYVTITAAGYATYCSTSALDFSNTGVTAYTATIANNQVNFTKVEKVPAREGVLLKGAAGTYAIPVIASADALTDNAFIGVTEATAIEDAGIFVLMNGGAGVGFYQTKGAFTVGANTAYLPALAGPARSFIGLDDVTSVKGITAETMQNGEVYNLQGQRVMKAQKGLYIVNGKKVIK